MGLEKAILEIEDFKNRAEKEKERLASKINKGVKENTYSSFLAIKEEMAKFQANEIVLRVFEETLSFFKENNVVETLYFIDQKIEKYFEASTKKLYGSPEGQISKVDLIEVNVWLAIRSLLFACEAVDYKEIKQKE